MIAHRQTLILAILLALAGCDGYGRVLYLKPPHAAKPPWSVTRMVIEIKGDEPVFGIVSNVASELGMKPDEGSGGRWNLEWTASNPGSDYTIREWFTLSVSKDEKGYWAIWLADFPTTTRSDYSIRAERAIRDALRKQS